MALVVLHYTLRNTNLNLMAGPSPRLEPLGNLATDPGHAVRRLGKSMNSQI